MFGSLGWVELLIILGIVVLIFGVGRIGKIGGELGQGVKAFREGVNEGKDKDAEEEEDAEETDTAA
jgi:sec-independent protein translocase protein TatA